MEDGVVFDELAKRRAVFGVLAKAGLHNVLQLRWVPIVLDGTVQGGNGVIVANTVV